MRCVAQYIYAGIIGFSVNNLTTTAGYAQALEARSRHSVVPGGEVGKVGAL